MKKDEKFEKSGEIDPKIVIIPEEENIQKIVPLKGMGSLPQNIEADFVIARRKNFGTFNKFCLVCKTSKNIGKFKRGGKVRQGKCNDCMLSHGRDILNET